MMIENHLEEIVEGCITCRFGYRCQVFEKHRELSEYQKMLEELKRLVRDLISVYDVKCCFCPEPLEDPLKITTHHVNGTHSDERPENKAFCHERCHRAYHARMILHKGQENA